MKNRVLVVLLVFILIVSTISGCKSGNQDPVPTETIESSTENSPETPPEKEKPETEEPTPEESPESGAQVTPETPPEQEIDAPKIFSGVLDHYYNFIASGSEMFDPDKGETGVWEAMRWKDKNEALETIGYAIEDVNGDKIPELLIGAIDKKDSSASYGSEIYAVYIIAKGEPLLFFDGWERSNYTYLGKGKFFYYGSSGAMYSTFATYTIAPDGQSLICNDYYFTYEKDDSFQNIGFYHNTTGQREKAASEELDVTNEEFWQIAKNLKAEAQKIKLIPFSEYKSSAQATDSVESELQAQWAKDALANYAAHDEFIADTSEHQVKVLFSTKGSLKNVKFLSLTMEGVDDNGKVSYTTKELYALDTLTADRPLVVGMTFFGDMPTYGISYVDGKGKTRNFSVQLSGEDGSLILSEF